MNWSNHLVLLPLFLTIIGCCILVIYAWNRKYVPGRTPFILLNLAIIFWSFCNFIEITSRPLSVKIFWANLEYFGIVSVPLIWMIFAIQYTGNSKWITPRNLILLLIVPIITLILVWTDRFHGLIRHDFHLISIGYYSIVGKTYGPGFWISACYNYSLLIVSIIVFLLRIRKPPYLSHGQVISLVICVLLPWLSNFLYITKLNPFRWMDLTPPSFALSAIVVAYGLIRFKLFDLVPIARDMVVEEMSDGVIVLNHEDIIIDMNSAALSIFNIGRREVLGQPVRDILQEWQLYVDRYKDVREISEQLIFGTDTNRIYYDFRISPLYNRRRVFCGRLIQLRNITALKSAEAELRESENTLKTIFLAAPIGIGYIQHEKLVWANDRFFNMMDYSVGEKIESINLCFETPEEFDRVKKTIKEEISAIGVCDVESRLKTRSGRILDALLRTALMTRSDDSRGLIFAAVDMTERKRMMKEIQRVQNLESIGVLAGGIAHDFNNILTAILGNLSLARLYSPQKDRTYDKILEAEKASERAKTLTNQLLTFSKGGIPVKTTTTIDGLLKESTLFALTGSNVKCEFEIPANLWSVDADAGQINQVIHNLILNADQSMPDGGILSVRAQNIQVEIGQSLPLKPGRYVKVTVEDHGIGIPQEHLHRIFDPYFTTKSKGSGLGLAMVHSIIKNHGGYVTVESQLGQGARFSFYLPAVSGKKITRTDEEQPVSGSGKILIMDDEEEVRKVSKEILETLGYDSVLTCNGQEAIESYSAAMQTNDSFAGVIMDLTIPGGMGGKEAVKKILFIDPNAKVIVASGYSNDPVMADYRQYGFKGVITKPFTIKDLSLILKKVLE